jgi:prepilin-type N-terminal cleavage/methylation domain-containing protein
MRAGARRSEGGFTLVELIVSLTVLAIGVVGAVGVMTSSFGVASATNGRSRAVSLATRELERLRAVPYAKLQVDPVPVRFSEKVHGTTFAVERSVTWTGHSSATQAYKQGAVTVTWSDGTGPHTIGQVSLYYPGGLGPAAATTTTAPCSDRPAKPLSVTAAPAPTPDGETAIDLQWQRDTAGTVPVAFWAIERSTDGFVTKQRITSTHPGTSTSLRVDGLASGTAYGFRVAAGACNTLSLWSAPASATTASSAAPACELGTPNVTPAQVKLTSAGNNAELVVAPVVSLNTAGPCSDLSVSYTYRGGGPVRTQALSGSGGIVRATLIKTGPWDVGVHSLDVFEGVTKKGSLLLTVCAHNASVCG